MNRLTSKISKLDATKFLLSVVFIALVFVPLGGMFSNMDAESLSAVLSSEGFITSLKNLCPTLF